MSTNPFQGDPAEQGRVLRLRKLPQATGRGGGRVGAATVALLAAAVLVAGCGHNPASPGVAKLDPSGTPSTGASASGSAHDQALAYAACIRNHGVPNFPDPEPNGGFKMKANPNDPTLQAAEQACASLLPGGGQNQTTGGNFTPSQVAQLLQYAKCMRAHGILTFPDPTSKGFGAMNGIDLNSSQFAAASRACQSLLPNVGGNGPVTR
jgi:hypothetical protein